MQSGSPALVCIVDAIPLAERSAHFGLVADLFGVRAQERRDVPNGYAFRFPPEAFDELARFVSGERRCCPFLAFEIRTSPGAGPLWLSMTGPEGTRDFLAAELPGISA
jgi:hypothetical protein